LGQNVKSSGYSIRKEKLVGERIKVEMEEEWDVENTKRNSRKTSVNVEEAGRKSLSQKWWQAKPAAKPEPWPKTAK